MLPQDAQSKIIKFTEVIKNETDPESAEFKSALTDLESVDKLIPDSVSDEFSKYNSKLEEQSAEEIKISKKFKIYAKVENGGLFHVMFIRDINRQDFIICTCSWIFIAARLLAGAYMNVNRWSTLHDLSRRSVFAKEFLKTRSFFTLTMAVQ